MSNSRTSRQQNKQAVKNRSGRLPWIMPEQCESCNACVAKCPAGCLKINQTRHNGVDVPWLDGPDACVGCGKCEMACPFGAISMTGYADLARQRLANKQKILGVE